MGRASPIRLDVNVLEEAADHLHARFGSLMDLSEELRNTLASVYYEVHWLRRKEGAAPLIAHLPRKKNESKMLDAAMKQAIARTGQYGLADSLVEGAREGRKVGKNMYGMMTRLALDILKWNIPNAYQKSEFRRSLEKLTKKPLPEVPQLYGLMHDYVHRRLLDETSQDDSSEWITLGPSARIVRPR